MVTQSMLVNIDEFGFLSYGKFCITPWEDRHVDLLFDAVIESKTHLSKFFAWSYDYDHASAEKWVKNCRYSWKKGTYYGFAIEDASKNLIGSVSIQAIDKHYNCASLGYWVRSSRVKEGAASSAAALAKLFAFGSLNLTRLELVIDPMNFASQKVAKKVGARLEGVARNKLQQNGVPCDAFIYGIIP